MKKLIIISFISLLCIPFANSYAEELNYVAQVTSKNVDGSERTRLFLTTKSECERHLDMIVNQAEAVTGVTKTFGAKCGVNLSFFRFFEGRSVSGLPYILASKNRDVTILPGASYEACMGMEKLMKLGVKDAKCIIHVESHASEVAQANPAALKLVCEGTKWTTGEAGEGWLSFDDAILYLTIDFENKKIFEKQRSVSSTYNNTSRTYDIIQYDDNLISATTAKEDPFYVYYGHDSLIVDRLTGKLIHKLLLIEFHYICSKSNKLF